MWAGKGLVFFGKWELYGFRGGFRICPDFGWGVRVFVVGLCGWAFEEDWEAFEENVTGDVCVV